MPFKTYNDNDNITTAELEKLLLDNTITAAELKKSIEKLSLLRSTPVVKRKTEPVKEVKETKEERVIDDKDEKFEDELNFYLSSYKSLDDDFTMEDLLSVIPSKDSYRFKDIIMRMQAESLKDIKDMQEIILEDKSLDKEDLIEYKHEIFREQRKITMLSELLIKPEIISKKENEKNNIILVPTKSGNMRIIEELQHIPSEYYPRFLELINSIIDGTFKNVKPLKSFTGIYEVKAPKTRIVFTKVGKNTYTLITAFVKKDDWNNYFADKLQSKIGEYRQSHDFFKRMANDKEFMKTNETYVNELFQMLSPQTNKKLKKGDLND